VLHVLFTGITAFTALIKDPMPIRAQSELNNMFQSPPRANGKGEKAIVTTLRSSADDSAATGASTADYNCTLWPSNQ